MKPLLQGCLVQVGNGMELDTVGRPTSGSLVVTWDFDPEQSW